MILFALWFFMGGAITIGWMFFIFQNSRWFRLKLCMLIDHKDGIEFHEVPDRGLDERIYKPRDGETVLSPGVIGRRHPIKRPPEK